MIVRRQESQASRAAAWFAVGLLPPAAIALYFRLALAPRNTEFGETGRAMIDRLLSPERYGIVLRAAAYEILRGVGPVLLALAVYALLLGRTTDRRARGMATGILPIVGFAALGYGFVYVTARSELNWLVSHSLDRLLLQLWPSVLFAVLLYVASPSERDAAARASADASAKPRPRRGSAGRR
jgi:hypothetical protein